MMEETNYTTLAHALVGGMIATVGPFCGARAWPLAGHDVVALAYPPSTLCDYLIGPRLDAWLAEEGMEPLVTVRREVDPELTAELIDCMELRLVRVPSATTEAATRIRQAHDRITSAAFEAGEHLPQGAA